jgi:hypothetical protein
VPKFLLKPIDHFLEPVFEHWIAFIRNHSQRLRKPTFEIRPHRIFWPGRR